MSSQRRPPQTSDQHGPSAWYASGSVSWSARVIVRSSPGTGLAARRPGDPGTLCTMNPRLRDGLLGASAAVLVIVLAATVFLWSISEPATADDARSPTPSASAVQAPDDLGADEMW